MGEYNKVDISPELKRLNDSALSAAVAFSNIGYDKQIVRLSAAMKRLGQEIGEELAPVFVDIGYKLLDNFNKGFGETDIWGFNHYINWAKCDPQRAAIAPTLFLVGSLVVMVVLGKVL
jgi:hypothetical protein